ncbi:MAG: amidohydrolase family protein [Actinobacteria bacterium]|nr:amidohydrolase family protein [Actinomycetota bacterium]
MTKVRVEIVVIRGGTALVGPTLRPLEDAVLIIEDGLIAELGAASSVAIPEGAVIVDASGMTLVPGFIDAHVHIEFADPAEVLAGGVTTVRDLAWPPESIWPLAERSRDPGFEGPLIVAAGQMLTTEGGYPTRAGWAPEGTGLVVAAPEDAAAAVDAQADAGASVIKVGLNSAVGPTLDLETLRAIVDAANTRDLAVTGHVDNIEQLEKALDAGMTELAHMLLGGERIPDEGIERMVRAGMTVVPTLSILAGPELEAAVDNLARFRAAGGSVVYGTDLGNAGPRPGIDPTEVAAMTAAGMSLHDILVSATVDAGALLGLDGVGTLSEGMAADIVALGGAPLADPGDLTDVQMVWRRGRRAR